MATRHPVSAGRLRTSPTAAGSPPPLPRTTLLSWVGEDRAVADVAAYFGARSDSGGTSVGNSGGPAYSGSRFEALAGGGDRPGAANRITADDVLAVKLLSVDIPAHASLELLEGELGDQLASLLAQVPVDAAITDLEGGAHLARHGVLEQAWDLLCAQRGIGWVSASKLLARKRPHLVPVYDRVVRCAFAAPTEPWSWLREQFRTPHHDDETNNEAGVETNGVETNGVEIKGVDVEGVDVEVGEDVDLAGQLNRVRERAGAPDHVSVLRLLDVVVWMRHRRTHRAVRCPGARRHDLETT